MSAITFIQADFTGTPDADDTRAAKWRIDVENDRLAPGTPLDKTPAATLKTNYLALLTRDNLTNSHADYIRQSNDSANEQFTEEQLQQIKANIKDRLEGGESTASIVTDTASL